MIVLVISGRKQKEQLKIFFRNRREFEKYAEFFSTVEFLNYASDELGSGSDFVQRCSETLDQIILNVRELGFLMLKNCSVYIIRTLRTPVLDLLYSESQEILFLRLYQILYKKSQTCDFKKYLCENLKHSNEYFDKFNDISKLLNLLHLQSEFGA